MDRLWKKARRSTSTAPMGFRWWWDRRVSAVREDQAVVPVVQGVSAVAAAVDAVRVAAEAEAEAAHSPGLRAQSSGHRA